jgi:acetolactate synthase-1/2/3 large subunit
MARVADSIVRRLLDAGVRSMFGVPGGGSNLDLIDAANREGLPFVLTSTETGAAIAAIAQSEISGRPGACLTTLGPGAASAVNGVACAMLERAPVIVFTDSHPEAARGCLHQRLDHHALLAPVTKWSASLSAENADATMDEALARATAFPPGPVHLDCPGDVLGVTGGLPFGGPQGGQPSETHRSASPSSQRRASVPGRDAFASARKPLLLVGLGARRTCDADAIRSFCETRRVPAMVTYKAKGVVPDTHPFFGGVFTNASVERPLIDEADLLIGVGLDPVEFLPRPWTFTDPLVDVAAAELAGIASHLPPSEWTPEGVRGKLDEQRARIAIPGKALTAQRVVEVAARRLAPDARVTVDAGAHMFAATMLWPVAQANDMLISNGLSTMGFALPAAVGASLMDRERPVVALTGDGGLLMCVGELSTAVRERLRIIVIVFADNALSLIQIKQEQRKMPPAGVALAGVAWVPLAESFGVAGFAAADEEQLDRAVEQALALRGPSLIEARIDPANYARTLRAVRG